MLSATYGTRIDRAIALARVVLAVFGAAAVWLDPTQPTRFQELGYILLIGYSAFALATVGLTFFRPIPSSGTATATHIVDLGVFSAVMYLTDGATSPFFVFFTFALLVATLRWSAVGVVLTAVTSLVVLVALGSWAAIVTDDPDFELDRFIVRCVYLTVAGFLLAYLAAQHDKVRGLIARLAAPLPNASGDEDWPARQSLEFASVALGAKRLLLAWADEHEPWQNFAAWNDGKFTMRQEAPDRFDPLVAPSLDGSSFLSPGSAADTQEAVICDAHGRCSRWRGDSVNVALRREFAIGPLASAAFSAKDIQGRLFVIDRKVYDADDVQLAQLAAARIGTLFEQHGLLMQLRKAAADAERLRIARDIHDGTLQFLAGAGLHLQAVAASLPTDPRSAADRIAELQGALASEQAQLRALVARLREGEAGQSTVPFARDLRVLAEHLERQWGVSITMQVTPADAAVEGVVMFDVSRMLAEAVANARRHGQAETINISVVATDGALTIEIADDGHGFPVKRLDQALVETQVVGPRSLRERTESLGGELAVQSSTGGSLVRIRLPCGTTASAASDRSMNIV